MIDVEHERLMTLKQAAAYLPNRPNVSTIFRWIQRGCRNVRLRSVLLGGVRHTSAEALQTFFAEVTAAADGERMQPRTSRQRRAAIRALKTN